VTRQRTNQEEQSVASEAQQARQRARNELSRRLSARPTTSSSSRRDEPASVPLRRDATPSMLKQRRALMLFSPRDTFR